MKNLEYLKKQLFIQIDEYYKDEKELQSLKTKVAMYDEIKKSFNYDSWDEYKSNLILLDIQIGELYEEAADSILNALHTLVLKIDSCAFKDELRNELYNELTNLNRLMQKILSDGKAIYNKKENLFFRQKSKKKTILEYRKILSNLKNNYVVTPYQYKLIYELMEKYEFSEKEQILIIEKIKNHNKKITLENYTKNSTIITKILTSNLESEEIEEEFNSLDNQAVAIYQSIAQEEITEIDVYLPDLDTGLYNIKQLEYIYKKIMNLLIENMRDCKEELSKKETYQDTDLKNMFVDEFIKSRTILDIVRKLYEVKTAQYEKREQTIEDEAEEIKPTNNIYFSYPIGSDKSYMEKDITKIPEESLSEVEKLLEKFRYGRTMRKELKNVSTSLRPLLAYKELRGDQVRIIFKNISGNNYIFVGLGLKKSDNDLNFYRGCANRNTEINQEQLLTEELIKAENTYQNIIEYITENKRKSNRYGGGYNL